MAETILSPGVVLNENNQTFITQQPQEVGAAIIGPTVKGPVETPTIVTSYSQYQNKFGTTFTSGSQVYTYLTSISAYNYFERGGTTLLVTRVTSGSFTPATLDIIVNNTFVVSGSVEPGYSSSDIAFTIETLSEGLIMNSSSSLLPNGALTDGTSDNLRIQITSPNTSSGEFTLLVRRGDDNTNSPVVLETWSNLSLDPFSSNYIEKRIGNQSSTLVDDNGDYYLESVGNYANQSNYIRVSNVNLKTPNYLDNNGDPTSPFPSFIPVTQLNSFSGATGSNLPIGVGNYFHNINDTNTQGLQASDYDDALNLLSNREEYKFKYISVPGLIYSLTAGGHTPRLTSLTVNSRERGDNLAIIDTVEYGIMLNPTISSTSGIDNTYVATYWPWLQTIDPNSGETVWVPASTMIPSVYAFNDSVAEPWLAPAGTSRGLLPTVLRAERNLQQSTRDLLYQANINPLTTSSNLGVIVFGQKTLQKQKSALDRVNVRRLLIELKSFIEQIANTIVFEQNTTATRNEFLSQVNPYLSSVQQREGLDNFRVVMDDSNNPPSVVDNNQLIGQIFIQPTRTVEFIQLDFNLTPSGVTFE
jgi:uncharacterized protein